MSRLGKQVVDLIDVTERFGDKTVVDDVTWHIGPGDRFGILGENGSGKTTLLKVVQGLLEPTAGHVKIGKTVKFAFLSQHLEELNELGQPPRPRGPVPLQDALRDRRQGADAGPAARAARVRGRPALHAGMRTCPAARSAACS